MFGAEGAAVVTAFQNALDHGDRCVFSGCCVILLVVIAELQALLSFFHVSISFVAEQGT